MQALQLTGPGELELVDVPVPGIASDELLVQTGAAVICTSDLNDIRSNPFGITLPMVIGHEGAGTVVQVGQQVQRFQASDRIAAHPVHPCGQCPNCLAGMRHLCSSMRHFGLNMPGTFAEYFIVRADRARKIPDDLPFDAAALAEPICVCLEALAQARLARDDRLLIVGDGPFGVLMAVLAQDLDLGRTVIAGHHDFRLAFASGARHLNTTSLRDPVAVLRSQADGWGYDAVILAVGTAQAAQWGLSLLRPRGRLVVFSAVPGQTPIDLWSVHVKELEIVGACNDQERLDEAVARLSACPQEWQALITHRFPIQEYRDAFRLAESGHDRALKVALTFGQGAAG
jgi:threonine dehydrogenase-like Zn-dependent dehydrogenase